MHIAEWVNIGAGGAVLLATLVVVTARRRWRAAVACVPLRVGRLDLVHLAVVILFFMLVMGSMGYLGKMLERPAQLTDDQWMGTESVPGLWAIMANNIAKLVTAGLVCVLAAIGLEGGLSSFGIRPARIGRDLVWCVLACLVVWPVCAWLANLIVYLTGKPPAHGVLNLLRSGNVPTWGAAALWVSAVLISPVAEELFFRGLLQTVIRGQIDRPWLAIVIASIAFGLMHSYQPQYVVPLAVLGLALGYVYEHTGSLLAPILIHILFNSRTLLLDLLYRAM